MLLYLKLVDETQISKPQEYTDTFKQNLSCLFLSVRGISKETFQFETPCTLSMITLLQEDTVGKTNFVK